MPRTRAPRPRLRSSIYRWWPAWLSLAFCKTTKQSLGRRRNTSSLHSTRKSRRSSALQSLPRCDWVSILRSPGTIGSVGPADNVKTLESHALPRLRHRAFRKSSRSGTTRMRSLMVRSLTGENRSTFTCQSLGWVHYADKCRNKADAHMANSR